MPSSVSNHDQYATVPLESSRPGSPAMFINKREDGKPKDDSSLTVGDFGNLSMLYFLYFCQSIPAGLVGATIPAILKRYVPYGNVGMFTFTIYPYCFKLIWAPIIDFYWSSRLGRRLTWLLPTQLLSGLAMVVLGVWTGFHFSAIEHSTDIGHGALYLLAWVFVATLGAIQSCVTDGSGVQLLSREKLHWVSSAHTLGSISGGFTAYSLFMFMFGGKLEHSDEAASVLGSFISYWGIFFLAFGSLLPLLRQEIAAVPEKEYSIFRAYKTVLSICRIRPIQEIVLVHLLGRLAFEVNDSATDLKLLDKGFGNANIAWLVLMVMPFDLASAHLAGVLSKRYQPLNVWSITYSVRVFSSIMAALVVWLGSDGPPSSFYLFMVFLQRVLSSVSGTIMFTAFLNFHLQIADPVAAGTYMTILATAQNMGGILPRIPVMKLIDLTTRSVCQDPSDRLRTGQTREPMTCNTLQQKMTCIQTGGSCQVISDGYYVTGCICLFLGVGIFLVYLRPTVKKLETLPLEQWALKSTH